MSPLSPPASVRPPSPGSVPVVIGKVYLMGLEFPAALNTKSPILPPPLNVEWRTADSQRTTRSNIRALRRRFGVVLSWDPSTNIAVVFVGTKAPEEAHRYLPFYGTARLPKQTREVLIPSPRDTFTTRPGYMNFTHAIRVVVVQAGDATSSSVPAPSNFVDVPRELGAVILSTAEIAKLRALHEDYWTGLRYTDNGESYYLGGVGAGGGGGAGGGSGEGGAHGYDESEAGGEDFVEVLSQFSLNMLPPKDYSGASISSDDVHNPIHAPSGLRYSVIIAKMSDEEDFRASQIELVEGTYTTTDDPPQIRCHLMELGCF